MDTVRTVFKTNDPSVTTRIEKYLPAILHCLWSADQTLYEARAFSDYQAYMAHRMAILDQTHYYDRHRRILESAFKSEYKYNQLLETTVGRLEPFFQDDLSLMFGASKGIPFDKMVRDGWIILVNLYAGLGLDVLHSRLLGTLVINEIIFAIQRLRNHGWRGMYNLYVDEAGEYANRNLARHLELSAKTGLRITISHQSLSQFEDPRIRQSVMQLTKDKVMFYTPSYEDRMSMMKALGYGGDIPPALAAYANNNIAKQEAVVKIGKTTPQRIRIVDVPDSPEVAIDPYLANDWNYSIKSIRDAIYDRSRKNTQSTRHRPVSDQPATRKTSGGKVRHRTKNTSENGEEKPLTF